MDNALVFSADKCSGCRYCELACCFKHKGGYGRVGSLIRIVTDDWQLVNTAMFCHHCKKPVCVDLCPTNAIVRDASTGKVTIDAANCIGCGACLACPLGGILIDADSGMAQVCDLCGGTPACVEYCPRGALAFLMPGEARQSRASIELSGRDKV